MKERNLCEYIAFLQERIDEKREIEAKKQHEIFVKEIEEEERRVKEEQAELDRMAHMIIEQKRKDEIIEAMREQKRLDDEREAKKYGWRAW